MLGPRDIRPFPSGCPWSGWAPPDIQHCEENLCGWIAAPADTWSNLAYVVAGLLLWRSLRAERGAVRWFPAVAAVIGLTSFAFHASFTAAFQFLDYVGMFLFVGAIGAVNLERAGWLAPERGAAALWAIALASVGAFAGVRWAGLPVQPIILVEAAALLALELRLGLASRGADFRPLLATLGLLGAGAGFWIADYSRSWCDPADHVFQAHAAWHLVTAAALVTAFAFYRQFSAGPRASA